ncbi:SCO family protein [Gemmata sp. JC717]|uniref:SCO family protein n=1 Tax=Gemmata algarum TaxID=2975278 RepID=UPI0021BAE6C7|nr:SCO family protein [Gemmata algarum]MDY3556552.1 SCO family protein [Gemmata algarum]
MIRGSRFSPVALLAALAVVCVLPVPAAAGPDGVVPEHDRPRSNKYEARIDEMIGAQVPLEVAFRDESDKPITLRECIGGKPTILVPVYYRCPMLCSEVLNGLVKALRDMRKQHNYAIGQQFNVVTVSMDPKEHGGLATEKKAAYVGEYGDEAAAAGWRFLTGTKDAVQVLLDGVGYRFEFDKMLKEYNHPSALIILSPEGKVTRYFYGIGYDKEYPVEGPEVVGPNGKTTKPMTTLRLSLVEAADGKGGSLADRVLMLCYRYDRLHQGYSLNVLRVVQLGGIVTLVLVVGGVFLALNREKLLGVFLRDALPYALGLIIVPFFGLVALILASPDAAMTLSPKLLVPYYVVAGGALYAWHRSRARLAAAAAAGGPNPTLPPEGTA